MKVGGPKDLDEFKSTGIRIYVRTIQICVYKSHPQPFDVGQKHTGYSILTKDIKFYLKLFMFFII